MLRCFVSTCLQTANVLRNTSIAFPALGTGYLGFPADVAAKVMFEEVLKFGNKFPKSNLKDVRFVIFPESPDYILEVCIVYKKISIFIQNWGKMESGSAAVDTI